jgi:4-amino-4-deoxy-L-arabinose transferase-like glycosyltransferase
MALIAFAVAAYFAGDSPALRITCGVLVGLAVLTRPEGAFLIPAFVLYRWIDRNDGEQIVDFVGDVARLAVPGAIAGAIIVGFSLIVSGDIGGTGGAKLSFFQEDEATLQYKLTVAADQVALFVGPLIPLIALAAIVAGRRPLLLFALFWVPVLIFYVLLFPGGLAHYFYRYQHPVLPFLAAFAGGGAAYLIAVAMQRDVVVKALVVLALAIVVVPMYEQYDRWRDIYTGAANETFTDLEAMALELNTIVEPDETLATHDIGAVQYFADYKVLDLVGLANEDVIAYHDNHRLSEYIELARPDYLLIFPDWDLFFLHLDAENNADQYELVKTYEGGGIRKQSYMLYRVNYE